MKKIISFNEPHLCLFAERNIKEGDEILYFYGETGLWWHDQVQFLLKMNNLHKVYCSMFNPPN